MRFPSEPNDTERKSFVDTALQEAARYEAETAAPHDLVARALARHERSGNRCGQTRPAPALFASACSLALLIGGGLWLHRSHSPSDRQSNSATATAFRPKLKAIVSNDSTPARIDLTPVLLQPIDPAKFLASSEGLPSHHRISHYRVRYRHLPQLVLNNLPTVQPNRAAGVWTTETVHREVVTQTLTPVWVAQTDPEARTIVLTPALYQLSLQPDEDADPTTAQVGAALIPVRFEQENTQP